MKRTLLVVGGGIEAVPGIQLAQSMGLHVVVSDRDADAEGAAVADDFLLTDTYDVSRTVAQAKMFCETVRPIHGVMCMGSDVPQTVAAIAQDLGLPGISRESARLATDKYAMKMKLLADGVPVPWFSLVHSLTHLQEIVLEQGLPLVIKPVDSRGARGVLRLTAEIDLAWAYQFSLSYSPSQQVLVERFLDGPQVSTETMMVDGVAHTPGFSDRNYELLETYAPHIIENGGDLPSHLSPSQQELVGKVVEQAARSLGIVEGVVKGDIVVHHGQPYIIEIAARLSGGYFCTHEIPLNTGVEFVRHAIYVALGQKPKPEDLLPRYQKCVAQRYLFPSPGRVTRISDFSHWAHKPGIAFLQVRVQVGDVVGTIEHHPARAGVVIATGETREEAANRAQNVVQNIQIETIPISQAMLSLCH
ncbi:ATP-grasp domain-containing protein [Candidatus Nitronereus thalassa]|uniref:ATP-grasp domain-containing protein n=1 Tax=Candidatus Nitronereus thalassa TaxID=3020898 RepID=A0ABU3K650_9BACT|nr:ATP-grasp domain-containing protein [Candidatus Nitronereus thalassa]MDT7041841.1 ATP-grasp domain-containing protein [Candidatus Nitronereus thalassa]